MIEPAQAGVPPEPWGASLHGLASELPGLVSDRLELFALELQRAGQALGQVVALAAAAATLGLTVWLALWIMAAAGLLALGLGWPLAGLTVVLVNLIGCAWALARMRALLPKLGLPATRRHLRMHAHGGEPPSPSKVAVDEHHTTAT